MSYAMAHRRAAALFPDMDDHAAYLSTKVGRPVTVDEVKALRDSFLSPLQRAYLASVGYVLGVYPKRKPLKTKGL